MSFRRWLARLYHQAAGGAVGSQAIQDALAVLSGKSMFDGPEHPVYVRLADQQDVVYLDLGDAERHVVRITYHGWEIIASQDVPVKFGRPKGMLPLPRPRPGGSLKQLSQFLNLSGDEDWALLAAFLVGAFKPAGPYAILALSGEQGSSKSTLARFLKQLVDPSTVPLRSEPRDARDLIIAASNSWLLVFDNFSHISTWLSDALCRLSTGGGFSTRELYTDSEEILFDAQRPVILTSIEDVVVRGDLLDRAIVLTLQPIPDERRKPESQLWAEFEQVRPSILAALLDAVSAAMRNLSSVRLRSLPRMADFALWAAAAEEALGLRDGQFMNSYQGNRADSITLTFEATPVAAALQQFMEETPDHQWQGRASELLERLNEQAGFGERHRAPEGWPKRADKLSGMLKRLAPNLRRVGTEIVFARSGSRGRTITIRQIEQSSDTGNTGVTSGSAPGRTSDTGSRW